MATIVCPHCGASNTQGSSFCEACGKALPIANSVGPQVVSATSMPTSAAGQQMLGDQLLKHTKRAANTLLTVGIIQLVLGTIVGVALANSPGASKASVRAAMPLAIGLPVAVGGIFIGLSFWARRSPLPASIVGLVLYSTLKVLNVIDAMSQMNANGGGPGSRGPGGFGIGIIDIVIVVFLIQGIKASLDHRKLLRAGGNVL